MRRISPAPTCTALALERADPARRSTHRLTLKGSEQETNEPCAFSLPPPVAAGLRQDAEAWKMRRHGHDPRCEDEPRGSGRLPHGGDPRYDGRQRRTQLLTPPLVSRRMRRAAAYVARPLVVSVPAQ